MVVVIFVELGVKLNRVLARARATQQGGGTNQIQDRHFHHTLIKVGCSVLDDLDRNNFLCLQVLAFYDLAEGALAKDVKNQVAVPMLRDHVSDYFFSTRSGWAVS